MRSVGNIKFIKKISDTEIQTVSFISRRNLNLNINPYQAKAINLLDSAQKPPHTTVLVEAHCAPPYLLPSTAALVTQGLQLGNPQIEKSQNASTFLSFRRIDPGRGSDGRGVREQRSRRL